MTNSDRPMSRRAFLQGAALVAGATALSTSLSSHYLWAKTSYADARSCTGTLPLRKRAARKGLIYGATTGYDIIESDSTFAAHFARECGILVPETELKWAAVHPTLDGYDFAPADALLKFAQANDMLFRGHPLVWHQALPSWFQRVVTSENAEQILKAHIANVVGHYAGSIHSWDVVNEAVMVWDRQPGGLRNTPWLKLLGPRYVDVAFRAAAEADPNALLVLNQNHLEYEDDAAEKYRTATLDLLKTLRASGTPVHALGIEAHLSGEENSFAPDKFRAFLHEVADLGLKVIISEMDVADDKLPNDTGARDQIIAQMYKDFLSVVLEETALIAVLTWGLSDRYTWLAAERPRSDNAHVRPLPLDENCSRKLAWEAIAGELDRARIPSQAQPARRPENES